MLVMVSIEDLIPSTHPIRPIKQLADAALGRMGDLFDEMYAADGRPSIPPERLLKALLLMALFSVRSERQICERIGYDLMFRWFLDIDLMERVFDPTVFTKNRERLLSHEVVPRFLAEIVEEARSRGLLSDKDFSVDGTLVKAWASMKSFRPKGEDDGDSNGWSNFRGQKRSNETHESKTDPEAKLLRKGSGQASQLCYAVHVLMDNEHGLVVDRRGTEANGRCERDAAIEMVDAVQRPDSRRITLGADKGYDTRQFVADCRERKVTPRVAQNTSNRRSAIDGRTTCRAGYAISQRVRRRIEEIFGWAKTVGGLHQTRFKGRRRLEFHAVVVVAAYNILRIARLAPVAA